MDSTFDKGAIAAEVANDSASATRDAMYQRVTVEHSAALTRLAAAYEADPTRRQDLLQDIYFTVWRSLATFSGDCSLRTWIYRVAHNTAVTHVVRERRHRSRALYDLEELEQRPDAFDSERAVDEAQAVARLEQLIRKLKPLDRQVIVLHLEGLKPTEISSISGLSAANVATKVHRLRQLLVRHFNVEVSP
jgi:RNA polymerase sigma-70 factor (ECF subfamily)